MSSSSKKTQPAPSSSASFTIEGVLEEVEVWRKTKSQHQQPAMPDPLWSKILSLTEKYGETRIRSMLNISKQQYETKKSQLSQCQALAPSSETKLDFCAVSSQAPAYQPIKLPKIDNITVVEFCRSDGMIMKIHTTTEHMQTIIDSFAQGNAHVTKLS